MRRPRRSREAEYEVTAGQLSEKQDEYEAEKVELGQRSPNSAMIKLT